MSQTRRKFSTEFKTKVVLDALKERETLESLAKKYELQPTQISKWKADVLKNFGNVFTGESAVKKEKQVDIEKLYSTIGQQKVEIEYLKKICYETGFRKTFDRSTTGLYTFEKEKMWYQLYKSTNT